MTALHALCREGRIYDVERWIIDGRPLQLAEGSTVRRRSRHHSALEIALDRADHGLVTLLLCNGYDPNAERGSPLDAALRARRWDLLDLLLAWGADPDDVCLDTLFGTYNSALFQRFMDLGVDLTAYHEMATALGYHASNKPLFGFARRHRKTTPAIQHELDIALAHHAGEGNEKGVSLCLWAGADPHAPVPSLRYGPFEEDGATDDDEDRFLGFSAVHEACSRGHVEILEQLGPDPEKDDLDDLYRWAGDAHVIDFLAPYGPPKEVGAVIGIYLGWLPFRSGEWRSLEKLRALFRAGARWEDASKECVGEVRRSILSRSDGAFQDIMKLLAEGDHCSAEVRAELARTPSIRKRMKEAGFYPAEDDEAYRYRRYGVRGARKLLAAYGIELPKPPKQPPRPLPRTVDIGGKRQGKKLEMDRSALFERVWSTPMVTLAKAWGMSDRGLAKACRRLKIPVPPRGYWARKSAGQRLRRPRLPNLKPGEAEEVVVWLPD